ncbi:nucleoid-associated protein YejK, partial [Vibrio anguillarum]|nr:nucleoid-associated protein YejK [Vibrio anguillarum]
MSISLNSVAIHQLVKNGQDELVVNLSGNPLPMQPA